MPETAKPEYQKYKQLKGNEFYSPEDFNENFRVTEENLKRHEEFNDPHPEAYYTKQENDELLSKKATVFYALEELELTTGSETIEQIVRALPEESELTLEVTSKHNLPIYKGSEGNLRIAKTTNARAVLEFMTADYPFKIYRGVCLSGEWTGWVESTIDNAPDSQVHNIFLDPENGNDENLGTSENNPIKTIEEARKRFYQKSNKGGLNLRIKSGTTVDVGETLNWSDRSFSGQLIITTYPETGRAKFLCNSEIAVVPFMFSALGALHIINIDFERTVPHQTNSHTLSVYFMSQVILENITIKTNTRVGHTIGLYASSCPDVTLRGSNDISNVATAIILDYNTELAITGKLSGTNNYTGISTGSGTVKKVTSAIDLGATTPEIIGAGGQIIS